MAIKLASAVLIFIGAWGSIILFAITAVFSYFVFAGKSFISRQSFAIAIFSFAAVSFVIGSNFGFLVAAIVIAGALTGVIILAWQAKKERLIPQIRLAGISAFGLITAGILCFSFGALIWPLFTGSRGKNSCFDLFCFFLVLMSVVLVLVLIFWYWHYFLPAWRNSRLRPASGS